MDGTIIGLVKYTVISPLVSILLIIALKFGETKTFSIFFTFLVAELVLSSVDIVELSEAYAELSLIFWIVLDELIELEVELASLDD